MNPLHSKHILLLLWMILCFRKTDHIGYNGEGYPPFWNRTSSSLEDFITEHKIVINFWNYLDRMSIYRTLLNATSSYIYKTESKIMRNALWGLPLQHGWQYQTGRLGDTANVNNTKQQSLDPTISPRSWWACMNYYLCAIPFLGAVDAGLFNNFPHEIELTQPEEFQSDFCSGVTDCKKSCPEAMAQWKAFFEFLKNSSQVPEQSSLNNSEEEGIVSLMWKAHVESIRIALPICSKRLNYLSAPERNFGRNWAKAVEFLAAAYFPTDFESVNNFQMYLPPRRLKEGDKAPNIADFGMEQNRIVFALDWLNKGNIFSVGHLLQLWKKAMCSEEGRAAGRRLMQNMVDDSKFGLRNMIAIITELIKNFKCEG